VVVAVALARRPAVAVVVEAVVAVALAEAVEVERRVRRSVVRAIAGGRVEAEARVVLARVVLASVRRGVTAGVVARTSVVLTAASRPASTHRDDRHQRGEETESAHALLLDQPT